MGVLSWVAVMVDVPGARIVTVSPTIVATLVSELTYEMAPLLFVVGATKANGSSPIVFVGMLKFLRPGEP